MTGAAATGQTRAERTRRPRHIGTATAAEPSEPSRRAGSATPGRRKRRPGTGAEEKERVLIELTRAQVDQVVRSAAQGGTMSVLLSALHDSQWTLAVGEDWAYPAQMEDHSLSRSLLSGLLVLSCFDPEGDYLGISELARTLDMNTSTTHRYVTTLLAVGLLERDHDTRRYRLAQP